MNLFLTPEVKGQLPRSDCADLAIQTANDLLRVAVENKWYTIPHNAKVLPKAGSIAEVTLVETCSDDHIVYAICRNAAREFLVAMISPSEALFHICSHPEVEPAVEAGIEVLLAQWIHDFWVLEDRERAFEERREPRRPQGEGTGKGGDSGSPSVVYLPRRRYANPKKEDLERCAAELEKGDSERRIRQRAEYHVPDHPRRLPAGGRADPEKIKRALEKGILLKPNHTFVKGSHVAGTEKRGGVYVSPSALSLLFPKAGEVPLVVVPDGHFSFERDVRKLALSLGRSVPRSMRLPDQAGFEYVVTTEDGEKVERWILWGLRRDAGRDVGRRAVRGLGEALAEARRTSPGTTHGVMVSTTGFSKEAIEEAKSQDIELINWDELRKRQAAS
jgi:hypothetical protein